MNSLATAELDESRQHSAPSEDDDDLPAFKLLTNDEEWERKAEFHPPGTYFIVANSDSFADLDEYRIPHQSPLTRESAMYVKTDHTNVYVDDATLILGVFEETPGRPQWRPGPESIRSDSSAPTDVIIKTNKFPVSEASMFPQPAPTSYPMYTQQDLEFSEPNLRFHYRSFVRRHLFRIPHDEAAAGVESEDLFEREATYCPPVSLKCLHIGLVLLTCNE